MDNKGRNFLHVAVQNSDIESVLFLISVQANVNSRVQDASKLTPLHLAVQAGTEIIVRNLVCAAEEELLLYTMPCWGARREERRGKRCLYRFFFFLQMKMFELTHAFVSLGLCSSYCKSNLHRQVLFSSVSLDILACKSCELLPRPLTESQVDTKFWLPWQNGYKADWNLGPWNAHASGECILDPGKSLRSSVEGGGQSPATLMRYSESVKRTQRCAGNRLGEPASKLMPDVGWPHPGLGGSRWTLILAFYGSPY